MFPYWGLFLVATISLASVVLADVIVQPGYEHSGNNPYPHQMNTPTEQYHTKQLPNQQLRYLQSTRTVYPYYESKDHTNLLGYPYQPYHHSPYDHFAPRNHEHYPRIGTHEYTHPSAFVGYRQPYSTGHYRGRGGSHNWGGSHHYRYRRSLDSDSTNTASSESAIVTHDNDVASKSPLTDDKHPKATDSLLPEHEPTNTNDKHVENRQTKIDHIMRPRLFGIYPQNIISYHQYPDPKNKMQDIIKLSSYPGMLSLIEESQKNEEACIDKENSYVLNNKPSTRLEEVLEEINDGSEYRDASSTVSEDFSNILAENMRHQRERGYTYLPRFILRLDEAALEKLYYEVFQEYVQLIHLLNVMDLDVSGIQLYDLVSPYYPERLSKQLQYTAYIKLVQNYIKISRLIEDTNKIKTRQVNMKSYIPFYSQMFPTINVPMKNEMDSRTPDNAEITHNLEQDLPTSFLSSVSDSNGGNYPYYRSECRTSSPNHSLDDFKNNLELQKNSNSAHNIEPSISIPNYSYIPNYMSNYDPNYTPDIDISVVPDYKVHQD